VLLSTLPGCQAGGWGGCECCCVAACGCPHCPAAKREGGVGVGAVVLLRAVVHTAQLPSGRVVWVWVLLCCYVLLSTLPGCQAGGWCGCGCCCVATCCCPHCPAAKREGGVGRVNLSCCVLLFTPPGPLACFASARCVDTVALRCVGFLST
jgi:hypothetical protein